MMVIILEIIAAILGIMWTSGVIYLVSKGRIFRRFYHDIMEWHLPNDTEQSFDGCSFHSHCRFCGKEIMQDSQGNWY